MVGRFFFIFSLFTGIALQAEYRAFTLMITNQVTLENKQLDSSLDPDQYTSFYPIKADEKIVYIDTWMCKGNTSNTTEICAKPSRKPTQVNTQQN